MKAVIFDMDGVLFDTERVCMEVWMEVAQRRGMPGMAEVFPRCIGLNANDSRQVVCGAYGEGFDYQDFRRETSECFRAHMEARELPVMPGAWELLEWLKSSGYALGLASSTKTESVQSHLRRAGMEGCFSAVVTGDMVEHSKPRPDIYLMACGRLGVEPGQAYAIEDSPNGIRSASAAGLRPIMVPDLIEPDEEMRRLSYIIRKDLREVLSFLQAQTRAEELGPAHGQGGADRGI